MPDTEQPNHPLLGTAAPSSSTEPSQPTYETGTGTGTGQLQHEQPRPESPRSLQTIRDGYDHSTADPNQTPDELRYDAALESQYGHSAVPETAYGYQLDLSVFKGDAEELNLTRDLFHTSGLPQHLAKAAVEEFKSPKRHTVQEAETTLRAVWKDGFDQQLAAAQSFIHALPEQQRAMVVNLLEETGLGNNPRLISQLANMQQHRSKGGR